MSTSIQPTVGRIVHYVLEQGSNKGQIRPAIITRVWSDLSVQLSVFTEVNDHFEGASSPMPPVWQRSSVLAATGADPQPGRWMWMPYQLGQAAKTAEAEAKQPQKA